ncbi:hypothetical protein MMC11_006016 [Xylographa trunciseda]|nr:hypothetical protein [Xylographa trunciseda]
MEQHLILDGLNAAQRAAVVSPASVLQILAPPGSGKTKTLTSRVAHLLSHHNYKPWNTLCLTFTIKSAKEMKARLSKLIGPSLATKLVLGTFHSVCRRYLVTYGYLIGVRKGFGIADTSDSIAIVNRITKRLKLNIDPKVARSRISSNKAKGIRHTDLTNETVKRMNVDQQEFITVFEAYESHLAISNLLDYDDLLLTCVDLLRQHPHCVSNVEVVLIDEFQDTNVVQFDLMRLFAAKCNRITTVGDPDQSIYGWRSAEIKNLKRMQREYPDTLVIHLEDNYRSSGAILLAALEVIEQDQSRPAKPLLPTHCPGTVPVLRRLPSAAIEATWIVTEIQRSMALTGNVLRYADYSILLRSASLSRVIESAMGKVGIPYRMVGGQRFFDRVEVKVLLDYLRVISQPNNSDALARIINIPSRRIGDVTIRGLLEEAAAGGSTLWTLVQEIVKGRRRTKTKIAKMAEQGLGTVVHIILTGRSKIKDSQHPHWPHHVLDFIINKLDYKEFLGKIHPEDHEGRWANVEELLAQASEYCPGSKASYSVDENEAEDILPDIEGLHQESSNQTEEALDRFLANVALSTELQREDEDEHLSGPQDRVIISTIHAAKGLEWPVVFIPSAYEGSIPHSRAEDADEERRLLYVAMTRAQALLYMSCPIKNSMREETTLSPFLAAKKVARLVTDQGPSLQFGIIMDICRILRRDCPSESLLLAGMKSASNLEDDLWPLTGEDAPEVIAARWHDDDNSRMHFSVDRTLKRRRTAPEDSDANLYRGSASTVTRAVPSLFNVTTTMQSFSTHFTAPHTEGFVPASQQLKDIRNNDPDASDPTITNGGVKRKIHGSAKPTSKNSSTKAQNGLRRYWNSSVNVHRPELLESLAVSHSNADLDSAHKDQPGCAVPESAQCAQAQIIAPMPELASLPKLPIPPAGPTSSKSMATVPRSLTTHSLCAYSNAAEIARITSDKYDSSKTYVFLSSSPPRVGLTEAAKRETMDVSTPAKESYLEESISAAIAPHHDLLPSSTHHITSMAQVQARTLAPKRTLGVRRSMVGWSVRENRTLPKPRTTGGQQYATLGTDR